MGAYVKKTARRRYDERQFTVRAVPVTRPTCTSSAKP